MILTGNEIRKNVENNRIQIKPFDNELIGTNSYDLCLDNELIVYEDEVLDMKHEPKSKRIKIPEDGLELPANSFALGASTCNLGSDFYVPLIHGKSTTARAGLFVHITADLIDIGFHGRTTFQLYNVLPIRLYPNMKIAQVSFWVPQGEIDLYNGKYQGASGPMASRVYLDVLK